MKKTPAFVLSILLACSYILPCCSYAAEGVPEEVLSQTSSVLYVEAWAGHQGTSGTAFVIRESSDESLLLTNEHVVHINKNNVTVWIDESSKYQAKVIADSEQYDLAVLKVNGKTGSALMLSENIKQGDAIYAVGFPGDADYLSDTHAVTSSQATITDGVVSAIRSMKIVEYGPSVSILQINADINHGNSGGPLFNKYGEVVGINTYGVQSASGIYGAIGTESIISFLKEANLFSGVSMSTTAAITKSLSADHLTEIVSGSYFTDTPVPIYWQYVLPGILVLGIIAAIIYLLVRKKKAGTSSKPIGAVFPSIDAYLSRLYYCLSCEDVVSLMIPVAKEMRDSHADGSLIMRLSPASIRVSKSGCTINMSPDNTYSNPQFTAPEQLSYGMASTKADIYSFCQSLSYMYQYGRTANYLNDAQANLSPAEATFSRIIAKGTAQDPTERYASMQEVLFDLAALNTGALSENARYPFADETVVKAKKNSPAKPLIVIAAITLVLIAAAGLINQLLVKRMEDKYATANDPENLYFWISQDIFGENPEYLTYAWAGHNLSAKDYEQASEQFSRLGDFYDSRVLYKECLYRQAETIAEDGDYDAAIEIYKSISDYDNSEEKILNTKYRKAAALANSGDYDAAIDLYKSIKDYKDSDELINDTEYRKGHSLLAAKEYSKAYNIFKKLKGIGYTNANEALNETFYTWGLDLAEEEDYIGAYEKLQNCKGYQDTSELIDTLISIIYLNGIDYYEAGKYADAKAHFTAVKSYQYSGDYLFLIECHQHLWNSESDITRLTSLIGFEDAGALIFSDSSAFYFMKGGSWYGNNGYITFYESNGTMWCTHNMGLPSGSWYFNDNVFSIGEKDYLYIVATGPNEIHIRYVNNGNEYTMTRK